MAEHCYEDSNIITASEKCLTILLTIVARGAPARLYTQHLRTIATILSVIQLQGGAVMSLLHVVLSPHHSYLALEWT